MNSALGIGRPCYPAHWFVVLVDYEENFSSHHHISVKNCYKLFCTPLLSVFYLHDKLCSYTIV